MLKMGVTMHELSPTLSRKSGALGDFRSSIGRLHAKLAVIDRPRLFIGSMNMDGRSARCNTELGPGDRQPRTGRRSGRAVPRRDAGATYRLQLADARRIEWLATEDGRDVVHPNEPHAAWAPRMRLSLVSMFVDGRPPLRLGPRWPTPTGPPAGSFGRCFRVRDPARITTAPRNNFDEEYHDEQSGSSAAPRRWPCLRRSPARRCTPPITSPIAR